MELPVVVPSQGQACTPSHNYPSQGRTSSAWLVCAIEGIFQP